jgi:hypothetical protein
MKSIDKTNANAALTNRTFKDRVIPMSASLRLPDHTMSEMCRLESKINVAMQQQSVDNCCRRQSLY